MLKGLYRLILLTCLLSCAVLGQESDGRTDPQVAPREVIQSFSRQFQQGCDRWGRPVPVKLQAILQELESALRRYPHTADLHWWQAMALLELGRYEEAVARFQEIAVSPTPFREPARTFLAMAAWKSGDTARAWGYQKPLAVAMLWSRFQPVVLALALALLTFLAFRSHPQGKQLLLLMLIPAVIIVVRVVAGILLAWVVQGYPFAMSDYPLGAWVALATNVLTWGLLLWALRRFPAPARSEAVRAVMLTVGWAVAAMCLWEGRPCRFSAFAPYVVASLAVVLVSAYASLGQVVRHAGL